MSITNDRSLEERQKIILQAIESVYERYVYCGTLEELGNACLEIAEKITGSEISFINKLDDDGFLHEISISISGKKQRILAGKGNMYFSENYKIKCLYKSVILEGKTLLTNDPSNHPDSTGIPKGHVNIESFLGVPFLLNGKAKGMVAVANRGGGYSENEKEILEAVAPSICEVLLRKQAEEALRESEKQYRELVESANSIIIRMDNEGIISHFNEFAQSYFGYSRDEAIGKNVKMLVPRMENISGRDLVEMADNILENPDEFVANINENVKKSGERVWVSWRNKAIRNANGEIIGNLAIGQDITQLKQAEEALRESEERFRTVQENSLDRFSILKPFYDGLGEIIDFTYVYQNARAAKTTGHSPDELAGHRMTEVWPTFPQTILFTKYKQAVETGQVTEFEDCYHADGIDDWFRAIVTPIPGGIAVATQIITEHKRADEALRESEKKYRMMIDTAREGIVIDSPEGGYTYVNRQMADLLGYTAEEIIGKSGIDFSSEEMHPVILRNRAELHKGKFLQGDMRYRRKDGSVLWTIFNITPVFNENGDHIANFAMHTDITDRKRTEEALKKSEARLEEELRGARLLQGISTELILEDDAKVIYDKLLDTAAKIMKSEFASLQILDKKEDGAPWLHLLATRGFSNEAAKNWVWVRDSASTACGEAYRSGKRVVVPSVEKCVFIQGTKDQQLFLQAGINAMQSTPLISCNGKIVGVISTHWGKQHEPSDNELRLFDVLTRQAADLIERREYEKALKESESQLEEELEGAKLLQEISTALIFENNVHVIYDKLLDTAKKIMQSDYASIQMLEEGDDNAHELHLLANRGFNERAAKLWEWVGISDTTTCGEALRSGKRIVVPDIENCDWLQETENLKVYLETGIHACQTTPLISRSGKLVGMISTHWRRPHEPTERQLRLFDVLARQAADIIERRKYEEALKESEKKALTLVEELEEADRNKNAFLNALSHELRNPLATISIGVQLLGKTDEEESDKIKETMESQIIQLCHLVDDLLDLTRINNNKIKLNTECLDIKGLVLAAGNDHKTFFNFKKIKFTTETNAEPVFVEADPVRLKQIIGNLLHNALKYTGEGGEVLLSLFKEKDSVVISVKDSGIGIGPEFLPVIFEPFTQADISLDRTNGGLGLGLSIVKGIAELHGGSVSASSEGLGKGAEFMIRLPLSVNSADEKSGLDGDNNDTKPLRVLLIEDNKDLADILCSMLNIMGHEAAAVYNGAQGIGEARVFRPEVIICDIGLPGMTGFEVAETIRKDADLRGIRLIALTGYAGQNNRELAIKAGFDRYLSKPVDMAVLKRVLAEEAGE